MATKLTAEWINAVGDYINARERIFASEMLKQVDGDVGRLRCLHNAAMAYPNAKSPYWAMYCASIMRTFYDHPNRKGELSQYLMALRFQEDHIGQWKYENL